MSCCGQRGPYIKRQDNDLIDYEQCLQALANEKDPKKFLHLLCQVAEEDNGDNAERPSVQCVVIPARNLCLELEIFDVNKKILERIIQCTFVSIFTRLGVDLYQEVYSQYAPFFKTEPAIDFATFSHAFHRALYLLYGQYRTYADNPAAFYLFLVSKDELANLENCEAEPKNCYIPVINYLTRLKFLEELTEEFVRSELSICQKFLRIEIDLVILMNRLTELATNTEGGISGVTDALRRVATGEANRYFEEEDFDDLFDAAEEIADVLKKIARLYRERFTVFKELGESLVCSRPQPPVKNIISEIPTIPPTVLI